MDSATFVEDLLGEGGALAAVLGARFEPRGAQVRMASAVARTFSAGGALLVEAGTGTGKSLAYLVAAVASGRRVIVSTGTRNLQDQILRDDLPLLERALGRPVAAVCLKGLTNFLCRRRLELRLRAGRSLDPVEDRWLDRVARWADESESGDRAELSDLPDDSSLWSELCATSETRLGPRCPFHEECFVTAARRAAKDAQIVVVNHHLFFADLLLRGGPASVLPEYEAVVFDEAHRLEDVATTFFGRQVSSRGVADLVAETRRALRLATELADGGASVEPLLGAVERDAERFFSALREVGAPRGRTELRAGELTAAAESGWYALDASLEALGAHLAALPTAVEEVIACGRRAAGLRHDLGEILSSPQRSAWVAWKESRERGVAVGVSPIDVSGTLREILFSAVESVVLTSATLAVDGSFAFVSERLGVEAEELILESPFDYPRQAALYLPRSAPDPRRAGAVERAAALVAETVHVVGGGALALFTSSRDMRLAAAWLRGQAAASAFDGVVRVQGERSRRALLEELRAHRGPRPFILCATASFWEGVDVPGDALRLVAIARLPFASPGDPLTAARQRLLESEGRDAFYEDLVPRACLALKQGFGRLIRSARDRGVVALLDRRARTMPYGDVFLRSLPECHRVETIDELRDWWRETSSTALRLCGDGGEPPRASKARGRDQ